MDHYLQFANGVQALRRKTSALTVGLGGALGVAANPLPHQLATVRRVLGDTHVRHLLSDEVGLGKTVQALMIINALRYQNPAHRTLVVAPDTLLSQWQDECWIRGHMKPAVAGAVGSSRDTAPVTLARPHDLLIRHGHGARTIEADPAVFDLLVVDEPQTMPREVVQLLSQWSEDFRHVLILSATPRLPDPAWRELLLRMIEPEAAEQARLEGRTATEILEEREKDALATITDPDGQADLTGSFLRAAAGRRIIRNSRSGWGRFLPSRRNHEVRVQPLIAERLCHEIAEILLKQADPEQGLQGPVWTAARGLQRSAAAARNVLADLAEAGGSLGNLADKARLASLEDPGDSRFGALLDILAEQWDEDPQKTLIVVCGDNPSIDMLRTALPRYFPDLEDAISVLRRPATADSDGVTNLREIQEALAPLLTGQSRLLLVGDWVQAGLNLHHVARGIIFFSLPWDIDSIDQLIGRIDRLGIKPKDRESPNTIDIWRILIDGSQEAAVADYVSALGIFDAPLPPLSAEEKLQIQAALCRAATVKRIPDNTISLTGDISGLPGRLAAADPFTKEKALKNYSAWRHQPGPGPAPAGGICLSDGSPLRREETALDAWLRIIARAGDFDIDCRSDKIDKYKFMTLWYPRAHGRGGAADSPFLLPGVSRDNWMSGHIPFIYERRRIAAPPRRGVRTDDGEHASRPLHFLDHGDDVHDTLVNGYATDVLSRFMPPHPVRQVSVTLPEGHPASSIGPVVLLSLAHLDPFPDEFLPSFWSPAAEAMLAAAPTEPQKRAMSADRAKLYAMFRALQRRIRLEVPAQMLRIGWARTADGWQELTTEQTDLCLQPLIDPKNNALIRGRSPQSPPVRPDLAETVRSRQAVQINAAAAAFYADIAKAARAALAEYGILISGCYDTVIRNRELAVQRRRQAPPDSGPAELWQGQIAAFERAHRFAQLNREEALQFVRDIAADGLPCPPVKSYSILLAVRNDL